jgi:hypothetical protein
LTLNGYDAPLDRLPLFVRAGAIIPMYPEMLYDGQKPKDPLTIDSYPHGSTRFSLYEDDGVTQEYRRGAFARTTIEVDAPRPLDERGSRIMVKISGARGHYKDMPAGRSYIVDLHLPVRPASVAIGDRLLPSFDAPAPDRAAREKTRSDFNAAAEGWFYDASDRRGVLHVKTKPQPLAASVTISVGL